jgi:hypothetical protein
MRRTSRATVVCLFAFVTALALAQTSAAVGPSLPAVDGGAAISAAQGAVSYVVRLKSGSTRLQARAHGRTIRAATLHGSWGIQLATLTGALTGLSPNGRVLVLGDNVLSSGSLRAQSRFAVIDTRALGVEKEITLRGDFTVDALSARGDLLYLIQHVSRADLTKYQVRGYDLRAGRLLPGVIADKSQAGWVMAGYPVSRATTVDGGWVYTLYLQADNYPFIHALDTVHHSAVCIGLPAKWTINGGWVSNARLKLTAGRLEVNTKGGKTRFVLNTATFRVTKG